MQKIEATEEIDVLGEYKKKFRQPKKTPKPTSPQPDPAPLPDLEPKPQTPEPEPIPAEKVKKPRTDAQIAAFKRAQEIRFSNAERRRVEREEKEKEYIQEVEEKLVKKAIAVKKRQIRQEMIIDKIPELDNVVDDDEQIRQVVQKSKRKVLFV